jgi:hypothetical protein
MDNKNVDALVEVLAPPGKVDTLVWAAELLPEAKGVLPKLQATKLRVLVIGHKGKRHLYLSAVLPL